MPPKVLIVDDEPLIHLLYSRPIRNAGYEPLCAKTAAEGLDLARAEKPVVIIMDVMLPGTTGLSALRELKVDAEMKQIPVIVITAAVDRYVETSQEAAAAGAALFLTKPISPPQFVNEIKRLLEAAPPVGVDSV